LARYKLRLTPTTFLPSYYRLGPPRQKLSAGGDLINSIKQAAEFGTSVRGQKLAALLVFLTYIHSIGLKTARGLTSLSQYQADVSVIQAAQGRGLPAGAALIGSWIDFLRQN
jgi:hypothetical protein